MAGSRDRKVDHQNRLRRIEGQLRHIRALLAEGSGTIDTIDVLTQIAATVAALRSVGLAVADDHVAACLADAVAAAQTDSHRAERKVAEASQAIARIVQS